MPIPMEKVFLHEGAWYVSIDCVIEGAVDEEVSWEDAKTPWSAARVAEGRHQECFERAGEQAVEAARKEEEQAAKMEVERVEALVPMYESELDDAQALAEDDPHKKRVVAEARERLAIARKGPAEARKRLREIKQQNKQNKQKK